MRSAGSAEILEIDFTGSADGVLGVSLTGTPAEETPLKLVRQLVNLNTDLDEVGQVLGGDAALKPYLPPLGLRVPGSVDPFELAVRAILGQQISVTGARRLASRLVDSFGDVAVGDLGRVFPSPATLTEAPLNSLGIPAQRAEAIRSLAKAVRDDLLRLKWGEIGDVDSELQAVPGIGPWTAAYIRLRGLGEADAIPCSDLGLRKVWSQGADPVKESELRRAAEQWRPYRGYAAIALWTTLL